MFFLLLLFHLTKIKLIIPKFTMVILFASFVLLDSMTCVEVLKGRQTYKQAHKSNSIAFLQAFFLFVRLDKLFYIITFKTISSLFSHMLPFYEFALFQIKNKFLRIL